MERKKLGEIWGFKTVGIAKTDEEMQSWIAQHDQSKLPNVGNNIWKDGYNNEFRTANTKRLLMKSGIVQTCKLLCCRRYRRR